MEARVKNSHPHKIVRALQGREFTKAEWRPVPPGLESEAESHPLLDVRAQPDRVAEIKVADGMLTDVGDGMAEISQSDTISAEMPLPAAPALDPEPPQSSRSALPKKGGKGKTK